MCQIPHGSSSRSQVFLVATGMAVTGGGRWRLSWIIVLLAFAAGICLAKQPISAGLHWLGLALLILAVGPVIVNPVAVEVRAAAWRFSINGMVVLTGVFILWYLLRLPSYGAGDFSSFTNQCMLLGQIVGMGICIALSRAIHGRSWRWGLLAILGIVPLLASGSRVATLATAAAGCFLLIRRKPVLGGLVAIFFLMALCSFIINGQSGQSNQSSDSLTGALSRKGTHNNRAALWQSRVEEFKSSPLFGIGIAMGTGSGSDVRESGAIRVEPGSSYLAVLAMTGATGFMSFFSALGVLLFGFASARRKADLDRDTLSVVGTFLAVIGVAEGWILGFGAPLCFLFWLWLGNVGDFASHPFSDRAKPRLSSSRPAWWSRGRRRILLGAAARHR